VIRVLLGRFAITRVVSIFVTVTVIMSGRKRKNYDPINHRNWPKERYIENLKNMGMGINTSWKVEVLKQLYITGPHYFHYASL
jgi:hypothetical protein